MKKVFTLILLIILVGGGYAHYHHWVTQSNQIKTQVEELAQGKNNQIRVTYDKIETSGYPFRHEITLKNPCFHFLQEDPNLRLDVIEVCLKGDMQMSYHPFKSDKRLFIKTNGELLFTLPALNKAEAKKYLVVGQTKEEFDFEDGYEYAKSSNLFYLIQNLRQASLSAKNLSIKSLGQQPLGLELPDRRFI